MFGLFKRKPSVLETPARKVYEALILRAREPVFYRDLGVADTVDGRFDMLTLHACLVLRYLEKNKLGGSEFAQMLFDLMFMDMENNLRELGVGDVGMPKRMKKLIKAFYGRRKAYGDALDEEQDTASALKEALVRNLYRDAAPSPEVLQVMAGYCQNFAATVQNDDTDAMVLDGQVSLCPLPEIM